MTPCNMMGYPMLEIFGSASPEVITTFYIPRKAPQHLYLGWEIRSEFHRIPQFFRFRTFWTPEFSSEFYFSDSKMCSRQF